MPGQFMISLQTSVTHFTSLLTKPFPKQLKISILYNLPDLFRRKSQRLRYLLSFSLAILILFTGMGRQEVTGETPAWIEVTEKGLSPQAFLAKYFPHHLQQGYSWRDLIREDGERIQDPRRDFILHQRYTILKQDVTRTRKQVLPLFPGDSSPERLQEQYEELYGLSQERHNQWYKQERHSLRSLYKAVVDGDENLRRKVEETERILEPFSIQLSDVVLALAKVESNYDHLVIGRHGEASVFQLTPRYAFTSGLKVYQWEQYLVDVKRYGERRAQRLHRQYLQKLVHHYQQQYPATRLLSELAKQDDRFDVPKVLRSVITNLTTKLLWFQREGLEDTLPLFFIGYNGGIGRLKRVLDHLQNQQGSLEESYTLLPQGTRLYTHKIMLDLALTQYRRLGTDQS